MPDQDGFPTNEEIVPIYDLIVAGTAFINPVKPAIDSIKSVIQDQLTKLGALESLMDPNGIINWGQIDFTNTIAELSLLDVAVNSLEAHTNRLSGTTLNFQSQNPNFLTLISTAVSLQTTETAIIDGRGTGTVTDAITQFFGSILTMPNLLADWEDFIKDLDLKIQGISPFAIGDQPMPNDIITTINGFVDNINNTISTENSNFETAITTIIRWGLSNVLIRPNAIWGDFVIDNIASPELSALIPES